MRQTNKNRITSLFKVILCVLLLICGLTPQLLAQGVPLSGVAVSGNPSASVINVGGYVMLEATFVGDSAPFTANFTANNNDVGSRSGNSSPLSIRVSASSIGDSGTNNSIPIAVTVTDASGISQQHSSTVSCRVDFTKPTLTTSITGGQGGSTTFGNNETVTLIVSADEGIKTPNITIAGPTGSLSATKTSGEDGATSFMYTIALNGATNGNYTVTVTAKDMSEPEANANSNTASANFTVGTTITGETQIIAANPASPSNGAAVTFEVSSPSGTARLDLMNGSEKLASISNPPNPCPITLANLEAKTYTISASSYDSSGMLISTSPSMSYTVDKAPPSPPTVTSPTFPVNTNLAALQVTLNCPTDTEISFPISVNIYKNGALVNTIQSNAGVAITNLTLDEGTNSFQFSTVDAAGNESEKTAAVIATYDKGETVSGHIAMALPANWNLPVNGTGDYICGPNEYTFSAEFSRDMDTTKNPTLTIITASGESLTSNSGSWENSKIFKVTIRFNQAAGASESPYDGKIKELTISGAYDTYGNAISLGKVENAFTLDLTAPLTEFDSDDPIYVNSTTSTVSIGGKLTEGSETSGSGVSQITLHCVKEGTDTDNTVSFAPSGADKGANIPWTYNFSVSGLEEGTYNITTTGTDKALHNPNTEDITYKTARKLIVDKTPPKIDSFDYNYNTTGTLAADTDTTISNESVNRFTMTYEEANGIDLTQTTSKIKKSSDGSEISHELTQNGSRLVLSFSPLVDGGYTVEITPVDVAGNKGETASRSVIIAVGVTTSNATFTPAIGTIANITNEALSQSQIWATLEGSNISYEKSKISVQYGGNECGAKMASESALIYSLFNTSGGLKNDQSHDGRYNITVTPISSTGQTGVSETSYFTLDTQAPVVSSISPASNKTLIGSIVKDFSITVSDSPKDIIQYAASMEPQTPAAPTALKVPGDTSWYESKGSGTVATFTITIDGNLVASTTTMTDTTGTMKLNIPLNDFTDEMRNKGMVDIQVKVEMEDGVFSGTEIPNKRTASYTYQYDFLAPAMPTFESPKEKGSYCKETITLKGSGKDSGTNGSGILAFKYSIDNKENWIELSSSGGSNSAASFSTTISIRDLAEGAHTIYVKSIDMAENESELSSVTFAKDTTPPEAPGTTYPFANAVFNTRTVSFRWTETTGAKYYLLQISDNAGFGTIINADPTSVLDTGLTGQLCATTSLTSSLPKDGTFYWRMASIEKVEDGYNVSGYSTAMTFTVDTVKPRILSISPTPCSSNVISNGQVTFTIIFNEPMNGSVDLVAQITTAGGQVMNIERESFDTNTWTGTTVIPKGNSALYDGNAVITVSGASDLAGNKMSEDTSHTVIINTGPAFDTKLFSNPANAYEIMILTKSSEALNAPPTCSVEQNGISTPVAMNFLRQRYYAGSYKIDSANPGKAYIYFSGTDLNGQVGQGYVQFVVADLSASKRAEIVGVKASVKAAAGSAYKASSIYMLDRDTLESPFTSDKTTASLRANMGLKNSTKASTVNTKELTPLLALEEIGPSSVSLKKCLLYEGSTDYMSFTAPEDKIHLYRQDKNGNWIFQGGSIKDYTIKAQLTGLGRLALMADTKEPAVNSFSPQELDEVDAAKVEFKGEFADGGSGLVKDSFKLELDGRELSGIELDDKGKFSYKMKYALPKGRHEISYTVQDKAGNVLSQNAAFRAEVFALSEFTPYPSPAKNYIQFQYKFGLRPDSIKMKIYDTAGHLVKDISDLFDGAYGNSRSARYDLTNRKGKRIANGVYFYKLTATRNGQTFKKTGKFAVLR